MLERIDGGLAARGKALNETLAKNTIEAAKTLSEGGREIAQGIGAKSAEIEESLGARAEALTQSLSDFRRRSPRLSRAISTR